MGTSERVQGVPDGYAPSCHTASAWELLGPIAPSRWAAHRLGHPGPDPRENDRAGTAVAVQEHESDRQRRPNEDGVGRLEEVRARGLQAGAAESLEEHRDRAVLLWEDPAHSPGYILAEPLASPVQRRQARRVQRHHGVARLRVRADRGAGRPPEVREDGGHLLDGRRGLGEAQAHGRGDHGRGERDAEPGGKCDVRPGTLGELPGAACLGRLARILRRQCAHELAAGSGHPGQRPQLVQLRFKMQRHRERGRGREVRRLEAVPAVLQLPARHGPCLLVGLLQPPGGARG
mmetsp:Transcript_35255/g.99050  ORF Transcript_35255/g.99050 Transcript_35255/m.99050 type:complete len:290 (+) Transcript_35255:458-1327(+)